MKPPLGDVIVRAKGLADHLLEHSRLARLASSAGSGALAAALQVAGYWPVAMAGWQAVSVVEAIDAAIDHETARRLDLLGRWLGDRRAIFAGVFEDEERRALRIRLRRLASGHPDAPPGRGVPGGFAFSPGAGDALRRARDLAGLAKALRRMGSPYAEPLATALRAHGAEVIALEHALDQSFARRARRAALRLGGRLLAWVEDGVDLENAWSALLGEDAGFVEGGRTLSRETHAAIAGQPSERARRQRLAQVFAGSGLATVFADPLLPLAVLEARATEARIRQERRAARLDPLGAAPILEFVLRLRAERANLRCINWGVAQGLPAHAVVGQLVAAS